MHLKTFSIGIVIIENEKKPHTRRYALQDTGNE